MEKDYEISRCEEEREVTKVREKKSKITVTTRTNAVGSNLPKRLSSAARFKEFIHWPGSTRADPFQPVQPTNDVHKGTYYSIKEQERPLEKNLPKPHASEPKTEDRHHRERGPSGGRAPRVGSAHLLSSKWVLVALLLACSAYYVVHLLDSRLPQVVSQEQVVNNPSLFSGARSTKFLERLVQSSDDAMTEVVLRDIYIEIMSLPNPSQALSFDSRKDSGAFVSRSKEPFTSIYSDIQNIVIALAGRNQEHALLVNCNYDSFPFRGGASSLVPCAVMLEALQVLYRSPARLKHDVVFLFNGAKESGLQGSHMFLKHPLAANIRAFLNLENAGQGGRAAIFQATPDSPWLFNYYAGNSPHPHGSVLWEELLQANSIAPLFTTDSGVFRDYFNISGLEFAFCHNGYVSRTAFDTEMYSKPASHQHLGDNLLATLRALGNASELNYGKVSGRMVYFDYLGWFMVRYPHGAGIAINILVFLLSVVSVALFMGRLSRWTFLPQGWGPITIIEPPVQRLRKVVVEQWKRCSSACQCIAKRKSTKYSYAKTSSTPDCEKVQVGHRLAWLELSYAVASKVGGMAAGVLAALLAGLFIGGTFPLAMPWFTNVWLLFILYWCPCLVASGSVTYFMDRWRADKHGLPVSLVVQLHALAAQVPWAIALLVLTGAGFRSAAVIMVPVLFASAAALFIHLSPLHVTAHKWIWVYLTLQIPSILFQMYVVLLVYVALLPLLGRLGPSSGDLNAALASALLAMYLSTPIMPLLIYIEKAGRVLLALLGFFLIALVISSTTDLGSPYKEGANSPVPQRYVILNTNREFYDSNMALKRQDSGYFIVNQDPNSPRTAPLANRSFASLRQDCEDEFYCGVPLHTTWMNSLSPTSHWIVAMDRNEFSTPTKVVSSKSCYEDSSNCTVHLTITGPERLTVTLSPKVGVTLQSWSLDQGLEPTPHSRWRNRPTFFLQIHRTNAAETFQFTLNFKVEINQIPGMLMDLSVTGNYFQADAVSGSGPEAFKQFLSSFPQWADVTSWSSFYSSHII